MKLVDEIIQMASDGKRSLADALRKCLILAFDLKNDKLKQWVEKELNGVPVGSLILHVTSTSTCLSSHYS